MPPRIMKNIIRGHTSRKIRKKGESPTHSAIPPPTRIATA
jgi:hypothetical protein